MILQALAAALLACPPAAAQGSSAQRCEARYRESYAEAWGLGYDAWAEACRHGGDADDILRQAQQAFIAACRKRFARFVSSKQIAEGSVIGYCSQGASGESRLEALFELPARRAVEPEPSRPIPPDPDPATSLYNYVRAKGKKSPKYLKTPNDPGDAWVLGNGVVVASVNDSPMRPDCQVDFMAGCPKHQPSYSGCEITDLGCSGRLKDLRISDDCRLLNHPGLRQSEVDTMFIWARAILEDVSVCYDTEHPERND